MYALSHNICCRRLCKTVIAAKWFAIRGIRLISQTKGALFVSPSHGSWVIRLQKDTFHSLGFHSLVTDFPISVTNSTEFILLRKFGFIFILKAIPAVTPYKLMRWSSRVGAAYTSVGFLHILWSPPTVQKWWALGWLESLSCPQVRACQRRSCARYSCLSPGDWIGSSAPRDADEK